MEATDTYSSSSQRERAFETEWMKEGKGWESVELETGIENERKGENRWINILMNGKVRMLKLLMKGTRAKLKVEYLCNVIKLVLW